MKRHTNASFGLFVAATVIWSMPPASSAETQIQGTAQIDYTGAAPDATAKQRALAAAKQDALGRFTSSFAAARYKLYQEIEPQITSALDQYLLGVIILDEQNDPKGKKYRITIRATLNDARLDAALASRSASAVPVKKAPLSFLFVARTPTAVKQFDARATTVANVQDTAVSKSSVAATQQQSAGASSKFAETGSSQTSNERTVVVTTGGSTVRQLDQVTYDVTSPDDMSATILEVFTNSGFEVYEYKDVAAQCAGAAPNDIYAMFAKADELSGDIRKAAFDAAKKCAVTTFATGTLDIGIPGVDPTTGNNRASVSVRAQVYDVSGLLPRVLASVGPVQYFGLGPAQDDKKVAERNALQQAARQAASAIADQLKAKGIN